MHNYTHSNSPQIGDYKNGENQNHDSIINVAIVGASGYSGMELGRCLLRHPYIKSLSLITNETSIDPLYWIPEAHHCSNKINIRGLKDLKDSCLNQSSNNFEFIFLATPAEISMEITPLLLKSSLKVIDLSGAFRLSNHQDYESWYHFKHTSPHLLDIAHYGLVPFNTTKNPKDLSLIANPGCYATSVQMALIPLLRKSLIQVDSLVIDSKSGTTGAGKKPSEMQLFSEVDEDCIAYRIGKHQHYPEIKQYLTKLSCFSQSSTNNPIDPIFSTTLLPLRRGLTSAIYARLKKGITDEDISRAYNEAYENYPLVRIANSNQSNSKFLLSLRTVVGSARTHITYSVDGTKLQIYSNIDNLLKGAASQAIENMNYINNWPIHTGLNDFEGLL